MLPLFLNAVPSESDKLCAYLDSTALQAENSNQNLDMLMKISADLIDLKSVENEALKQRLTFEDFKNQAKKKNIELPEYYRSFYHANYVDKYCGIHRTESESITIGKKKKSTQIRLYQRQFDPNGHPYYQLMKKEDHDKAQQ